MPDLVASLVCTAACKQVAKHAVSAMCQASDNIAPNLSLIAR